MLNVRFNKHEIFKPANKGFCMPLSLSGSGARMLLSTVALLTFLTALSGCAYFFPKYTKPELNIPDKWASQNQNAGQAVDKLPYWVWWKGFNDPDLDRLIEEALKNNLTIAAAIANMEAAQAELNTVKLNWLPFVNVFGGYVSGDSNNTFTQLGTLGAIAGSGAFLAVIPQYTLNLFRNYAMQKQSGYMLEMSKAEVLSIRLAVIAQVTGAYFTYLAQLELLDELNNMKSDVDELIRITGNMKKMGMATDMGISDLRAEQRIISGQIALAKRNLAASQNAVRFLINQPPGGFESANSFSAINPGQVIPGNLPVNIIESRPDIMKAEEALKAANTGVSVVSSNLLPSVNLNYFFAKTDSSINNNSITELETNQNYWAATGAWTISPGMFGQVEVNKATFKAAVASYSNIVNAALHEVDNALSANNSLNLKMIDDSKALEEIEQSNKLKASLVKKGLLSESILIAARMESRLLEIDITLTKLQQLITLVNLYQSLGGGYNYKINDSALKITKKEKG
jgi:NodT family efflux transporter outer membrane factor (OMF) lipoprotein